MRLRSAGSWAGLLLVAGVVAFQSGSRSLDFTTLGRFAFDEDRGTLADLPAEVRLLDGKHVVFDGYMVPLGVGTSLSDFVVLPWLYGQGRSLPPVEQQVVVRMPPGQPANYTPERIRVWGRLAVGVTREDGYLVSLFTLSATRVEVAPAAPLPQTYPWPSAGDVIVIGLAGCGVLHAGLGARLGCAAWRERRWVAGGRCPECGYDCRATPGRCPECGRETASR